MTIQKLTSEFINSTEFKLRLKNQQVKLNNNVVNKDYGLNDLVYYGTLDKFVFDSIDYLYMFPLLGDIKDYFSVNDSNPKTTLWLQGFTLISLSKREHYVFINL